MPAQPWMGCAVVLLLTHRSGREKTWLIQSRAVPDEDLVAARSRAGSTVCGSCFYLSSSVPVRVFYLFIKVCLVVCLRGSFPGLRNVPVIPGAADLLS